jgi:hypothetical protein
MLAHRLLCIPQFSSADLVFKQAATSVFVAKFVAVKSGMETVRRFRLKLHTMGVPIGGPAFVHGDNTPVIHKNAQRPESGVLKKTSNSVCHHCCRESAAMSECVTGCAPTNQNPANLWTEVTPGGAQQDHLVMQTSWDIRTRARTKPREAPKVIAGSAGSLVAVLCDQVQLAILTFLAVSVTELMAN